MTDTHPLRAAAYIRMSTSAQLASPERQRQLFRDYCARWHLLPVAEYADEGVSATHTELADREGMMRLLLEARRRQWDVVWCEDRNRIARKLRDWLTVREELTRLRIALVTHQDNPHQEHDSAAAEAMDGTMAVFNRYFARQLGEQMQRAQQVNVAKGRHRGGTLPPGLAWEWLDREAKAGEWAIHADSQGLAIRCFELFADCGCYQRVALQLNAEGITSRAGNGLSVYAVRKIILNPTYRGARIFRGVRYDVALPQIVPASLVRRVDGLLEQQALRPQRATHSRNEHAIFRGLLKCPSCESWLQTHSQHGKAGQIWLSYKCSRARNVPVTCDWHRMVPELTFERELLPVLAAHLKLEARRLSRRTEASRQQAGASKLRGKLAGERERVLRQHQQGWIDDATAAARLQEVGERLAALEATGPTQEPVTIEEVRAAIAAIDRLWLVLQPPEKSAVLQSVIEYIVPAVGDWAASEIIWQ